jgi:hypothetical protein
LNQFKACGKRIRFEPINCQWHNGKRFATSSYARSNDIERQKFYGNLRDDCRSKDKVFDAKMRRDWNNFTVFTNDTGLLDYMLYNMDSAAITHIRYTSEQYDEEIAKLDGIPFDILFKKQLNSKMLYKCYINSSQGSRGDGLMNLGNYIRDNPEHFTINDFLLNRMTSNSLLWASDYYFYCDDFDTLSLAILAGGNGIRKIYKTVKKEEQQ